MFDSVLHPDGAGRRRVGTGAAVSVALHLAALSALIVLSSQTSTPPSALRILKFVRSLPIAATGAKAATAASTHAAPARSRPRSFAPHAVVGRALAPRAAAPTVEVPDVAPAELSGADALPGVPSGTSTLGLEAPAAPQGPVVFDPGQGMTPPTRIAGEDPSYTREALAAGVEGTIVVRCVITTAGAVTGCRILEGLPHLDRAVIDALEAQRYTPVEFGGKPVAVKYDFRFRMVLPR